MMPKRVTHAIYLLLFTLLLGACQSKPTTIKPSTEPIVESVYAAGSIKSNNQYQVFSSSSGILKQVLVQKDDQVKKGQLLALISNDVPQLNVENSSLAASNADYQNNQEKMRELQVSIDISKRKMENDLLMLNRQRKLWDAEIGTRFEIEQRELAYANSKAAYESASLRYNELKKQLSFVSDQAKKSLSISRRMLRDYEVRSELDGKVYTVLKEKGEMINPQMPLALIGDANTFTIYLQVDENDIVKIKIGQTVYLNMDSYKGEVFEARISKINPLMNERSRSFDVEASFVKQPPMLYPNLTLEANIVLAKKENALTIPRQYLISDSLVMISKKDRKKVKIGLKDYQKVEILEGLTKDDEIYLPQ
jgi:multidrug efflux pump subunit AcrA (membrane-fusion protein)